MLSSQIFCKSFCCWFIRGVCTHHWRSQAVRTSTRNLTLLDALDAVRSDFEARVCWGNWEMLDTGGRRCGRKKIVALHNIAFNYRTLSEVNVNGYRQTRNNFYASHHFPLLTLLTNTSPFFPLIVFGLRFVVITFSVKSSPLTLLQSVRWIVARHKFLIYEFYIDLNINLYAWDFSTFRTLERDFILLTWCEC